MCRQSRADALSAVKACMAAWGLDVLDPQLAALWRGMRNVLLSRPESAEGEQDVQVVATGSLSMYRLTFMCMIRDQRGRTIAWFGFLKHSVFSRYPRCVA